MSASIYYALLIIVLQLLTSVYSTKAGDVRLVSSDGDPRHGVLEVWYNGKWGGVCDDYLSNNDHGSIVVCCQLGFPTSRPTYKSVQGTSVFNLDDVKCTGNETHIADCIHNTWGTSNCVYDEHFYIQCSDDPCVNVTCENGGRCHQTLDIDYRCDCLPGFYGHTCENDTDECLVNNGGCSHVCENTMGSYHCQCPDVELSMGSDNHTCYAGGLHVLCTSHSMEVTLDKHYFKGIHGQYLTLRDNRCTARDLVTQVKVTVPLEGCGTNVQKYGNSFVYENQIISHLVPIQGLVSRVRDMNVTVRCYYSADSTAHNHYVVDSGKLHFTDNNQGEYNISMDLIHNGHLFKPTGSLPLRVEPGEKLSVKLSLLTNDSHLQVFARNCQATPTSTNTDTKQYLVLDNGCSTDPSLTVKNISDITKEIISLETFKFSGDSSTLYLHCEVLVCDTTIPGSRCKTGCLRPGTGRREVGGNYLTSQELSVGPIQFVGEPGKSKSKKSENSKTEIASQAEPNSKSTLAAGLALLGVVLVMTTLALTIIFKRDEEEDGDGSDDVKAKLLSDGDCEK